MSGSLFDFGLYFFPVSYTHLVYTGPGFLYEPVDSVDEGQTLGILGRTDDSRWVLVRLPSGREGWIAAEIIHIDAALANVPVVTGIAPPQVVGWQSSGGQTSGGGKPAATATGPSIGGGKQPISPTTAATEAPATATDAPPTATNVPATATTAATATAEPTTAATVAPTRAATDTPPATATPPASPTPRATATAAPTDTPGTSGDATPPGLAIVYVYATPDDNAEPILRVVPGQSVVLIGRTEDALWIKIWLPGGQEGWVRTEALQLEIDVTVLPVVEP